MHKHELERRLSPVPRSLSEKTLQTVFKTLCESTNSPHSLACWILYENKEFAQLVNMDCRPSNYRSSHEFAKDYLVSKFLSKFPDFKHEDLKPEKAAKDSFQKFEEICKSTNKRFSQLDLDPSLWDPTLAEIFFLARRKIKSVLGKPDLQRISDSFGWGPGATSAASGDLTSAYVKFSKRLDVTSNSLIMGHCCINSTPSWVNCQLQTDEFPSVAVSLTRDMMHVVRGNEVVFVPKNAKTHRIIAKEPHVNSYLQKGFGAEIRRLLRAHAGVNLNDQTLNQRLAKRGSIDGSLATIDLQGASDTISFELVKFLLPADWFSLLDQIRSKQGYVREDKTWFYYHKFSSMGNAYTFELESLIFWALCKSCLEVNDHEQTLSVYGDDLIVPTDSYGNVVKVLNFAGFSVNELKSFSSGPFRESCGKDYFFGDDVRPIFLKESISNVESLFKLANSFRRYAHRRSFNYGCDSSYLSCWLCVCELIPLPFRNLKIPEGFGDVGLVSNFDEAVPSRPQNGWDGYLFKGLLRVPVKQVMRDSHAGYTASLSAISSASEWSPLVRQTTPLRGVRSISFLLERRNSWRASDYERQLPLLGHHDLRRMTYPKIARVHTHSWYDFGPWNN
jgi:hypothetical protein